MSRLVNDGLPLPLFMAVQAQQRAELPPGQISVTQLLQPPRARALEARGGDQLVRLASRSLDALMGSGLHEVLAKIDGMPGTERWAVERRWYTTLHSAQGTCWTVSGGIDIYQEDARLVQDYKACKIFKVMMLQKALAAGTQDTEEWVQQVGCYGYILRCNGKPIERAQMVLYIKDWNAKDAAKFAIPTRWLVLDIPLWQSPQASAFMKERVSLHEAALTELPRCSDKDTWGGRRCEAWCDAYPICSQARPELADAGLEAQLHASLAHLASGREGA